MVDGSPATLGGRTLRFLASTPVVELEAVTPRLARSLAEMDIVSVCDLLTHYPRRWIDRSRQVPVAHLDDATDALVIAEVCDLRVLRPPRGRGRARVEVDVDDGTGRLTCVFFNQPWRRNQLPAGTTGAFYGRIKVFRGRRQMANPVVDLVGNRTTGRIVALYPSSEKAGVTSDSLGRAAEEALQRSGRFADPLPDGWRRDLRLVERDSALRNIHLPKTMRQKDAARRRLAFDELFRLQLLLVMRKRAIEASSLGIAHPIAFRPGPPASDGGGQRPEARWGQGLVTRFVEQLPFALTGAQERAIAEIFDDMASPIPMHRLLQGDVGAGKTVVAAAALLAAVEGGRQGALMAPTEVLAGQHELGLLALTAHLSVPDASRLGGLRPLQVALLTNKTTAAQRARIATGLASGKVDIVIGTHALLTDDVRFASLGAVVIDEQHRFGVEQRAALRMKGRLGSGHDPDVLVMTATPIPRTAAMTVYGDLDVTVVDELPPGRLPVRTIWARGEDGEAEAWQRVRDEVAAGGRAYVVCPLVEGSDRVVARSVVAEHDRLSRSELNGLAVGLLHGQMPARDKVGVMDAFRSGKLDVLVATTVIEVGVDVAEATVMVIEDAERFGLAQLHQLRGRVGRSGAPSWCYLLGGAGAAEGSDVFRRLRAMEDSNDGFALAEVDLEVRGEGTILNTRQKGRTDLRLASLRRDRDLVEAARTVAVAVVAADPTLDAHPQLADEIRLFIDADDEEFLFKS